MTEKFEVATKFVFSCPLEAVNFKYEVTRCTKLNCAKKIYEV